MMVDKTHEEKIENMRYACNIVGFGFTVEHLDLLVSLYELIIQKEGNTSLKDIAEVKAESEHRELNRKIAKEEALLKTNQNGS